jgi:hypothetical protein
MNTVRALASAIVAAIATALAALVVTAQAPAGGGADDAPWVPALQQMDEAIARKDVNGAVFAFQSAYGAALGSRRWQGMVDVGDAALRLPAVAPPPKSTVTKARQLYLTALFRARAERSLEGVLRVAEAFADIGDARLAAQSLAVARAVADAADDTDGSARIRAIEERVHERALTAERAAGRREDATP